MLLLLLLVLLLLCVSMCDASRPLPRQEELYDNGASYGRVGVLNFATPEVWEYARFSVLLWQQYCDRHRYEFFFVPLSLDRTRHDVWSKVIACEQYLPRVDWLLFAEADTVPIDEPLSIETHLIKQFVEPDTLVLIGTNCGTERWCWDEGPNTSVYLMRNTPETMALLRYWYTSADVNQECNIYLDRHPREQLTFWHCVMKKYPKQVKLINYKYLHGVDGVFAKHLLGFGFSKERKIEEFSKIFVERGLNKTTCDIHTYPCGGK